MEPPASSYLDTASGEPLHPAARDVLEAALARGYADPRRLHGPARDARLLLDNARAVVAECLGVRRDEVAFTASGSQAVHLGVLGLLSGGHQRLLASAVEHSAVLHAGRWHASRGGAFETLPVDARGRLHVGTVTSALSSPSAIPSVVAVQSANHEVGTTQPVSAIAAALPQGHRLFVDACASGGRLDLPGGWDAAALSAHKWGGPAGVGVLLVRKGARWQNPFPSDNPAEFPPQGESPALALAAAASLRAVVEERGTVSAQQRLLVDRIRREVARIPDVEVVGDPENRLPHLVTFSCLYVDGETIVTELDRRGFAVASGSACTASTLEPSHVLAAMGALTHGNVRISLGRTTTAEEVDRLLVVLPEVIHRARRDAGAPS